MKNDIEPSTGWPIDSISMCERMDPNWCKNDDLALERPRRTKINPSRQGKRTQCQAYMLLCPRVQKLMRNSCNTCRMDGGHMHSPFLQRRGLSACVPTTEHKKNRSQHETYLEGHMTEHPGRQPTISLAPLLHDWLDVGACRPAKRETSAAPFIEHRNCSCSGVLMLPGRAIRTHPSNALPGTSYRSMAAQQASTALRPKPPLQ